MKRSRHRLSMIIALLLLMLTPQMLLAAPNSRQSQESGEPTAQGVDFKLTYQDGLYTVYARPNFSTAAPQFLLGSQVTIKVPHALDTDRFTAANIVSAIESVEWQLTSRVDSPAENQAADYLSFTLEPLSDVSQKMHEWSASQEIKLFSFENAGTCLGAVEIMDNADAFYLPVAGGSYNSAYTDPVNSFIVAGKGDSYINEIYMGIYDSGAANCSSKGVELAPRLFLPLIAK